MSLQNLINQYITKTNEIDRLKEEKQLIEKKLSLMDGDLKNIRQEINNLFPANTKTAKTFLVVYDGNSIVFQIDTSQHPDWPEFITFCEVTPIEEFTLKSSVSTEDIEVCKYQEDPQWDEMKYDR